MERIRIDSFGTTRDGRKAHVFSLTNKMGMQLKVSDFGATVVSILSPPMSDGVKDMVMGYDDVAGYEDTTLYLGATIGRYAGQITGAEFTLGDRRYQLPVNDHGNCLHGGGKGFDKRLFDYHLFPEENRVDFTYLSPDGEEGFPGNLEVCSSYTLTEDNRIIIRFTAESDMDTVLNMTNHNYYNLDGHDSGSILDHGLTIYADEYLMVGDDCSPTGVILPVEGSPMDFRKAHRVGERIDDACRQLAVCGGYDHNWNIRGWGSGLRLCAGLSGKDERRSLHVYSDLPGLQMYSGNYLDGTQTGKGGAAYGYRGALCLEPQYYPCAPGFPHFPSPVLKKGQTYDHTVILAFSYQDR